MRRIAFPAALWLVASCASEPHPSPDDIEAADVEAAERVIGLPMTESEREMMLEDIRQHLASYEEIRSFELPNDLVPALVFDPGFRPELQSGDPAFATPGRVARPSRDTDLAFMSVGELGVLLREGAVTSVELTHLYIDRIRRHDPMLRAVITLTEARALAAARNADRDFAAGIDRGPLQGIPYGLKDLFAVADYPTTWGARPYEDQVIGETATVARRLEEAGAVLLAKTSVGALAMGDVWFGGQARTPWNPEMGASGSSAGSAAGVAAGLFPFAIGTETNGSIVSPSVRNGVAGLRPTFGAVSRAGAMALSWSMDKVGPICRYAEDCALVFDAIRGPDGVDPTVRQAGFPYSADDSLASLRLAYLAGEFSRAHRGRENDRRLLDALDGAGITMDTVQLPDLPVRALSFVLEAEAAAAFDTLTRSGRDDLMVRQVPAAWPNVFRAARFIPAVEYIQANRLRTRLVEGIEAMIGDYDVVVAPCPAGDAMLATNLTGHPLMAVSTGLGADGLPTGICLIGRPFGEAALITAAQAFQELSGFYARRAPGFGD